VVSATEVILPTPTDSAVETSDEEATPTTSLPTPTAYTEDAFRKNYRDNLSFLKSYARISESDLFWIIESQLLAEKLMEVITADLVQEEEQVWARHILFKDEETQEELATEFYARIQAGEDFMELVDEFTSRNDPDSETGNNIIFEDLGWFGENRMISAFEEAAFSLEIGEISEPVDTSFGWHVIQLLGHEVRPLSDQEMQQVRQNAFEEWLTEQREGANVEINPDWLDVIPLEPDIPDEIKLNPVQ
jgi:parvulin-like peptidyl-prolyl isomerase